MRILSARPALRAVGTTAFSARAATLTFVLALGGFLAPAALAGHGNGSPEVSGTAVAGNVACPDSAPEVGTTLDSTSAKSQNGSWNGSDYTINVTPTASLGGDIAGITFEISTTNGPTVAAREVHLERGSAANVYDYNVPASTFYPGIEHDDMLANPSGSGSTQLSFCLVQIVLGNTPVELRSFSARRTLGGGAVLRWRTASEIDFLGFNVYRQVNGRRVRLNRRLIAAKSLGSGLTGGAYSWRDRARGKKVPSKARYVLEAVHLDGTRTVFRPVRASA